MSNAEHNKVADAVRTSWVHRLLPLWLWPYAQLARWERPIGWKLLLWPCLWSLALAILVFNMERSTEPDPLLGTEVILLVFIFKIILFLFGAIAMRGAGCTYNDLADVDIDNQVARTRSRPLPSGRVSKKQALLFMLIQLLIGSVILLQFNQFTIYLGIASLITVLIYPFMKRVTWWPQLFLGFAFSWGALMGWPSVFGDLAAAPIVLYVGCILWVIGYDTIYAHQDKEDDALVGVKSTARLFAEKSKLVIGLLYAGALFLFLVAYMLALPADFSLVWPSYCGLSLGAIHMAWQIIRLDIDNPDQCLSLFKSNSIFGWLLFAGLTANLILVLLT